jgi:hypothetical protein
MKCKIQWIDCNGKKTIHDADAVAIAVYTPRKGALGDQTVRRFPICAEHLTTLRRMPFVSHHDANCNHISSDSPCWTEEPLLNVPRDFPVRPLLSTRDFETAKDVVTCGSCGLSWDDAIPTQYTPAPSARCPFEAFHKE